MRQTSDNIAKMVILTYLLSALLMLVFARIEEDPMPDILHDCYATNYPINAKKHQVQSSCLNSYLSHLFGNNTYHGLDKNTLAWIDSLGRKIHVRLKRQARPGYRLIVRKEIRALTNKEREDFFDAVNGLKNEKVPGSALNKYDAIALLHQDQAIPSAHNGYNFPSWHRYYLVLFEEALRTKQRGVALPYWDSRIDFRMTNPDDTILFSEVFFGNGKGVVYTGPFAMWRTPSQNTYLRRDIPGPNSSLIDPVKIQNVLNKRYHREILNPTSASDDDNLERHHDGVHRWVGGRDGHIGGLDTSPMDPVFWLHHCFVDYLWENFRKRQISLGINPETDYPPTTDPNHQPNNIMANLLPPKKNIDGYSNSFTREIYTYADAPTCQNGCGRHNHFLYCDSGKNGCVSRSRKQFVDNDYFKNVENLYVRTGRKRLVSELRRQRRLGQSGGGGGGGPGGGGGGGGGGGTVASGGGGGGSGAGAVGGGEASGVDGLQNATIELEPQLDTNITALEAAPDMPRKFAARIVDPRTRVVRKKRALDIQGRKLNIEINLNLNLQQESQTNTTRPFKNPYNFNKFVTTPILINHLHQQKAHNLHNQKTFNITLQTDGFTYNGRHVDNVIIDERSVSTDTIAYIAFEKPYKGGESKAYVTVSDSYGGVCMPSCLVDGATYQDCSGVVKVTDDFPLMYVDSAYRDPKDDIVPFLKFSCETHT